MTVDDICAANLDPAAAPDTWDYEGLARKVRERTTF